MHAQRSVRDSDIVAQKIEFYLNIYFAISPLLKRRQKGRGPLPADLQRAVEVSMAGFRTFLETRGAELSRTPEFLPYYALPYVPQPADHPTFRELFMPAWLGELRGRVAKFFADAAPKGRVPKPQIYGLLESMDSRVSASHAAVTKDLFEIAAQAVQALERLSPDDAGDMRKRLQEIDERLSALEEQTVQHSSERQPQQEPQPQPRPQQQKHPQHQTQHNQVQQSAGDPPQAHNLGQAEAQAQDKDDRQLQQDHEDDVFSGYGPDDVPPAGGGRMGSVQDLGGAFGQSVFSMGASPTPRGWAALDYGRVREVLLASETRPEDAALLMQALRWRVTKTPAGKPRRRALQTYINGDVLGCTASARGEGGDNLCSRLSASASPVVVEQWARFVNCAASECSGRTYLLQHRDLVKMLCGMLKSEPQDNALRRNVLGALQKFSLRHDPQNEMIDAELIAWIVEALGSADAGGSGEVDGLSEYSIEYGTALLMNLSLRAAGKRKAETVPTLTVLNALLEMDNPQVRTYVNGTLYSVLTRPVLKEQVSRPNPTTLTLCIASMTSRLILLSRAGSCYGNGSNSAMRDGARRRDIFAADSVHLGAVAI